jgi:hypothetical protein
VETFRKALVAASRNGEYDIDEDNPDC